MAPDKKSGNFDVTVLKFGCNFRVNCTKFTKKNYNGKSKKRVIIFALYTIF